MITGTPETHSYARTVASITYTTTTRSGRFKIKNLIIMIAGTPEIHSYTRAAASVHYYTATTKSSSGLR